MPPDPYPNNKPWQAHTRQRLRTDGTPAEAALWRRLQRRQLGGLRFRRQFGVGPYVLDFYCPAARLAVELDGAVHDDPARAAYDATRTHHLARVGVRVIRFENRRVFDEPDAVLAAIAEAAGLA
ncbi:endonuclease domain-containing protein [Rubrivirga sp.]|uniref:endonuclease domain-containing protein n=1 Tax=Rubrivirga sp. TaxID=1885344 RepID=UPI003B520B55